MAYTNNSVFWVGGDGNVYIKNGTSVRNAGKALGVSDNGFDAANLSGEATRINDPNPVQAGNPTAAAAAPSNPTGRAASGGTAAAAPARVDKSNDIALNNAGLSAVDTQLNSGLSSIDSAFGKLTGQYDTEAKANEGNYTTQSETNTGNLQKNKQTAFVNASAGRSGLFGQLSALGALNGDGITLANRAVQKGANDDLSGAADSYGSNQQTLDTAIGTFRQEDKIRRENATTTAENARTNVRNDAAKNKMSFLSNLSNDYAAMGDEGQARNFSSQAAALYPTLASTSIPNSNLAYTGASFQPGALSTYTAGANSTAVSAAPVDGATGLPGLVATPTKKKLLAVQV